MSKQWLCARVLCLLLLAHSTPGAAEPAADAQAAPAIQIDPGSVDVGYCMCIDDRPWPSKAAEGSQDKPGATGRLARPGSQKAGPDAAIH